MRDLFDLPTDTNHLPILTKVHFNLLLEELVDENQTALAHLLVGYNLFSFLST